VGQRAAGAGNFVAGPPVGLGSTGGGCDAGGILMTGDPLTRPPVPTGGRRVRFRCGGTTLRPNRVEPLID